MMHSKREKVLACLIGMSLSGSLIAMAAPEPTKSLEVDGNQSLADGTRITVSNVYNAYGIVGKTESTGTFTIGGGTGTLYIDATSNASGNSHASGLMISDDSHVTINGNLAIKAYGGSCFATGLGMTRAGTGEGQQADITVNGNLTMGDPSLVLTDSNDDRNWGVNAKEIHGGYGPDGHVSGWADNYTGARWQPSGVRIGMSGGSFINLNGDVMLVVRGAALTTDPFYKSGTMDPYDLAVINANKGNVTIITPNSTKESFYAAASYGGTININMNGNEAAGHAVNIKGNVIAMKENDGSGGQYFYRNGRINLGLNTADSQWIGVVDNSGKNQAGEVNLWLQNGAQWIHDAPSLPDGMQIKNMPWPSNGHYGEYKEVSYINKLTGGADDRSAGMIRQDYASDISIADYSGNTVVFYGHDEANPQTIIGGDFKIGSAAEGSSITLVTDSKGITAGFADSDSAADRNNVSEVLNKLANKLWYTGYADKHLKGTVKISEGLTASSASKKLGDISFSTDSTGTNQAGQGYYEYTPAADPVGNTIYGLAAKDTKYVQEGIRQNDGTYKFTKDYIVSANDSDVTEENLGYNPAVAAVVGNGNDVTLDAAGHTLGLEAKSTQDRVQALGVYTNKTVDITAKQLSIEAEADKGDAKGLYINNGGNVTIHGNVSVKAKQNADGSANGINLYDSGSKLTIDGNLTMRGDNGSYGVSTARAGGYGSYKTYQAKGIYIYDKQGAALTVTGDTDISVKGHGIDMRGSDKNVIDLQGKTTILTPIDLQDKSGSYELINGAKGKLYIGMNAAKDGVSGKDVVLQGFVSDLNAHIHIGLGTANSKLTGFISKYEDENGTVNLYLKDGGSWHHQATREEDSTFKGSHITKLSSDKGVIYQNDANPIRVDNYSGNTTVFYKHDEANPQTIIGGDFKIDSAAEGSSITLVTDSKGITAGFADSDKAADKNNVSEVLNKLANKLWYTGYTDGHLTGTVKISEGLTASSASKKVGEISFSTTSTGTNQAGQGYYKYTPAEDEPVSDMEFDKAITGVRANDTVYVDAGILVDDGENYSFNKDASITAIPAIDVWDGQRSMDGVDVQGAEHAVNVNAAGHTLTVIAKADRKPIVQGIQATSLKGVNITADKLVIDAQNMVGRVEGISVGGQGGMNKDDPYKLTINGDIDMKVRGKHYTLGLYAAGNGDITFNGNVTSLGDDTSEWGIIATNGAWAYYGVSLIYSGSSYSIQTGPKVTINGDVNAKIDGNALFANGGHSKLTINGGGNIEINKDNTHNYHAMIAECGTTSMNVNLDQNYIATGASDNDLVLKGNIAASTGAIHANEPEPYTYVNLGLATNKSEWTGVAQNRFKDTGNVAGEKTFYGAINLWLQNGAIWNHELWGKTEDTFKESHLAKLVGGDSEANAGIIFQNSDKQIRVDNYSGNTTVVYKHEIVDDTTRANAEVYGNKAASVIGGDFRIANAAEGSTITLLTDSAGVNTVSVGHKDQNLVYDLMDKLANKLWYTGYADGHLKGIVKISDGLTASSMMMKLGDISFSTDSTGTKQAGQGYYKYDVVYPSEQVTNPIDKVIDGSDDSKNTYRNDGVYHDSTGSYDFTSNPADVTASDKDDGVIHASYNDVNVTTKEWLNVTAKDGGVGVAAENGKAVTTKGNTRITAGKGIGVKADGGAVSLTGDTVIQAGTGMEAQNGGTITADGKTDITAEDGKNALHVDGDGSAITLKDGTISGAVLAENKGKISTNGADLKGTVTASGEGSLALTGGSTSEGITADGGSVSTNGTAAGGALSAANGGTITMTNGSAKGLAADGTSTITASLDKEGAGIDGNIASKGNVTVTLSNGAVWTGDSTGIGTTKAAVGSGSTWTGKSENENTAVDLKGTWKQTGDSTVASLTAQNGILDKSSKDSGATTIGYASGMLNLIYSHDEQKPTTIYGGDTTISTADTGTTVNMITDSKGLKVTGAASKYAGNKNQVSETLNQLAHKLIYTANDGNITGKLKIAEGLTSSSASLRAEDLSFDENGRGFYKYDPAKDDITIEYGSNETQMMRGTKSALLGVVTLWRTNNNDLQRRLGDVRLGREESGVWARYVGGKNKFNEQSTYMNQSYDIGQAGYDKRMGGWIAGVALDYAKGNVSYTGGKGKERMTTLALYGTRAFDDGRYLDVIVKTGKLKNKFDVSNEIGKRLSADYNSWGNSFSVEYGKRFVKDNGFYLDPSVELTAGRVNSKDFTGHSELGELYVKQHAFDSAIGRIGLGIGCQTDRSNAYLKLALAHEFSGKFKTDFFAADGGLKNTKIDLSDTWLDMEVGGSLSLGKGTYLYGTYTHNFGAKLETKWRMDVGVRYTF